MSVNPILTSLQEDSTISIIMREEDLTRVAEAVHSRVINKESYEFALTEAMPQLPSNAREILKHAVAKAVSEYQSTQKPQDRPSPANIEEVFTEAVRNMASASRSSQNHFQNGLFNKINIENIHSFK